MSATPVDVEITGTLVFFSPPNGFWDASVFNGQTYSYSFQFDSAALDQDSDPTSGIYNSPSVPFQCDISFGNYLFTTTGTTVVVWDNFNNGIERDGIFFSNLNPFTQNGLTVSQNGLQAELFFSNTSFLSSDSLSGVQTYPVSDFSTKFVQMQGFFNNGGGNTPASIQGSIDTFVVTVIPEPSSWAMVAVGAAVLLAAQRFLRKRG